MTGPRKRRGPRLSSEASQRSLFHAVVPCKHREIPRPSGGEPAITKRGLKGLGCHHIIAGAMEILGCCQRVHWRCIVLAGTFALCCHAQESEPAAPALPAAADSLASHSEAPPSNALEIWLNALAVAESGNRQWLVHRDRDGQLYFGCLQFHAKTFRVYVRKFHLLPNSSRSETMRRIYDCAFQKRLAALMIRDDPQTWRHWRGTVEKRVGLPPVDVDDRTDHP